MTQIIIANYEKKLHWTAREGTNKKKKKGKQTKRADLKVGTLRNDGSLNTFRF